MSAETLRHLSRKFDVARNQLICARKAVFRIQSTSEREIQRPASSQQHIPPLNCRSSFIYSFEHDNVCAIAFSTVFFFRRIRFVR